MVYTLFGVAALLAVWVVTTAVGDLRENAIKQLESLLFAVADDSSKKHLANLIRLIIDDIREQDGGVFRDGVWNFARVMLIPVASASGLEVVERLMKALQ